MRRKAKAVLLSNLKSENVSFFYRLSRNYLLTYLSILGKRPLTGPMLAVISPTYRCNLKCEMCNFWKKRDERELEKEAFFEVINDLAEMKTPMISFSGGEPFLREDIFDLIQHASSKTAVHIASNGTLITREMARRLCDLNVDGVTVSLDASEAVVHNHIRGDRNSFQKALEGLQNLVESSKDSRLSVDIVSVLSEGNAAQILPLLELARRIGIDAVGIIPLHKMNDRPNSLEPISKHELAQIETVIDDLIKNRNQNGIVDNSIPYLKEVKEHFRGNPKRSSCSAGWTTCVIDAAGHVYPCYGFYVMGETIGNIRHMNIRDIWFSDHYNHQRKQFFLCKKCLWNCHGEFDVMFRTAIRIKEIVGN